MIDLLIGCEYLAPADAQLELAPYLQVRSTIKQLIDQALIVPNAAHAQESRVEPIESDGALQDAHSVSSASTNTPSVEADPATAGEIVDSEDTIRKENNGARRESPHRDSYDLWA